MEVFKLHTHKKVQMIIMVGQKPTYSIYYRDPNDFFLNGIMELLDQYERLYINLKLSKVRKTKVKSGNKACGTAPIGYR